SKGFGKFIPLFEVRMAEGGFGAGPGDRMEWDNRWDLGLQARWNLNHWLTQQEQQRATMAKVQQVHFAYQDLRGKLTAGVQEARETILTGKSQLDLCLTQIKNSDETYKLSFSRLENLPQSASYTETLLAVGSIGRAKANYLSVINSFDKAQLRLMVLLGGAGAQGEPCRK
ncbi:MAG TPA: TolC family protein, partial [Gemmataceae bacterium]|nr:TolC family protein [Gemmataceae bacterium]